MRVIGWMIEERKGRMRRRIKEVQEIMGRRRGKRKGRAGKTIRVGKEGLRRRSREMRELVGGRRKRIKGRVGKTVKKRKEKRG